MKIDRCHEIKLAGVNLISRETSLFLSIFKDEWDD